MDLKSYLEIGVSLLGVLGGLFAFLLNLKIRHDILDNNRKIEEEIQKLKDETSRSLTDAINLITVTFLRTKEFTEFQLGLSDKVLSTVNGKYVRTDLYNQSNQSTQEKFISMKELIEVNMSKIESGLDRQIVDLKDRIFHNNPKAD